MHFTDNNDFELREVVSDAITKSECILYKMLSWSLNLTI